jgi:hypothetical protein
MNFRMKTKSFFLLAVMCTFYVAHISAQELALNSSSQDTDLAWTISLRTSSFTMPPQDFENYSDDWLAHCFCQVSHLDNTNRKQMIGELHRINISKTYSFPCEQCDANQTDCNTRCTNAAAGLSAAEVQNIANIACSKGVPNGTAITAWSAVGTREYKSAQRLGILENIPASTTSTCKCPPGWLSNTTNVDGGITTDGKCKKMVCNIPCTTGLPPDGALIGSWGFYYGKALWQWGAPNCTSTTTPAICRINK